MNVQYSFCAMPQSILNSASLTLSHSAAMNSLNTGKCTRIEYWATLYYLFFTSPETREQKILSHNILTAESSKSHFESTK